MTALTTQTTVPSGNEDADKETLTPKQELFCANYAQNDEFFGNATLSYADAYGFDLDSMTKDDGLFLLKSGEEISEEDYNKMDSDKVKGAKRIRKSSYQTAYDLCSQSASRLRRNVKIQSRCRELLNELMRDDIVDSALIKIIIWGQKEADKVAAIREYNQLKARIVKKADITSGGKPIYAIDRSQKDIIDDILSEFIGTKEQPKDEESNIEECEEGAEGAKASEGGHEEVRHQEVRNGDIGTAGAEDREELQG